MSILIGADMVPTASNVDRFCSSNTYELIGKELQRVLSKADFRIFNLEVPLADQNTPIKKCGPALIAPTATAEGMKAIGANLFTLANNHIMDQGEPGLRTTCNTLKKQEIDFVGAGETPEQAATPYIFVNKNKTIGVYACAEHEFSIVSKTSCGANPYDPLESFDHIVSLKEKCDYVIVLYHGGKEHYRYPSPELQKTCRKFVNKGADLVVCQHSHCIGCEEVFENGRIVYGQGNFLFDLQSNEFWQTGLLVEITDDFTINYIPVCKNGNAVRLAGDEEKKNILDAFAKRSEDICVEGFVQAEYTKFAASMQESYLLALSGIKRRSFFVRALNKLTGGRYLKFLLKRKYGTNAKLVIRNFVECEAHRELLLRSIGDITE